jgi:hypothetical protein
MYWYKSKLLITIGLGFSLISGLQACRPDIKENRANMKYFDLQGYFKGDSARLSRSNPTILKKVEHNNIAESKKIHIKNWGTELSLFSQSYINKPAWKDSYSIITNGNTVTYRALDTALKTRSISIQKINGKIKCITIFNSSNNTLYHTQEKLSYFPDSLYLIQKVQSVMLLGTNRYTISGKFN